MDFKRILSALLGFPLVVIMLIFGNKYVVDIFLSAIALLSMQEYFNAVSKDAKPVRWVGYLSCIIIALIHIVPENVSEANLNLIKLILLPTIMLILFAQVIITNMKTNFKDIAYTLFGMAYVVGFTLFVALIRGMDNGRKADAPAAEKNGGYYCADQPGTDPAGRNRDSFLAEKSERYD